MEAVQVRQVIEKDGEVWITGLPYKRGQPVEVIVLAHTPAPVDNRQLTVGRLRLSGLLGMWNDRTDIPDSAAYARELRRQAEFTSAHIQSQTLQLYPRHTDSSALLQDSLGRTTCVIRDIGIAFLVYVRHRI